MAVQDLPMATLYREQDRLAREVEACERAPGFESQASLRRERIALLEEVIARRYAEGRGG